MPPIPPPVSDKFTRAAWSQAQRSFVHDFKCASRPFPPDAVPIPGTIGRVHGFTRLMIRMQPDDVVRLSQIQCDLPSRRHGGTSLSWLCGLADKHGMTMRLLVSPFGNEALPLYDPLKLSAWYMRRGFTSEGWGARVLVRRPGPKIG